MSLAITSVRTEGLGDTTHVLVHDGIAVVVDPQRDIDRFERVVEDSGADLRFVLETHIHNDYVSGGRHLAVAAGAELVMPAGAGPVFRHRPAFHLEDITHGPLTLRPIHTPGHTPEHVSYLVMIDGRHVAVFSGGSLLVGAAGRTDLLGDERAETLARLQHGSVHRLAALPDQVTLHPTHGAGSFCTTSGVVGNESTIGHERKTNPVLAYPSEDSFAAGQLSGLGPYPSYYRHMGPLNLVGLPAPRFDVAVLEEVPDGVTVIDGRPAEDFAAGHIPGSLGIELRDSFGTWVGWVTEHNTPIVLVLNSDQDLGEALRQLARIGYDDVRGVIRQPTGDLESYRIVDPATFLSAAAQGAQVLDVRAPDEWHQGTIGGSITSYLPDVAEKTPSELDPGQPVWLACGSGYRASIAASILQSRGFEPVVLADTGVNEVLSRTSSSR